VGSGETLMDNIENKSSAEISNIIDQKEKELSIAITNYYTTEQEKLVLQKEILEKQTIKKDLEIALSKAGHILRQLNIELKLLRSKFWSVKNSGT
jgi:hypothetical protein